MIFCGYTYRRSDLCQSNMCWQFVIRRFNRMRLNVRQGVADNTQPSAQHGAAESLVTVLASQLCCFPQDRHRCMQLAAAGPLTGAPHCETQESSPSTAQHQPENSCINVIKPYLMRPGGHRNSNHQKHSSIVLTRLPQDYHKPSKYPKKCQTGKNPIRMPVHYYTLWAIWR